MWTLCRKARETVDTYRALLRQGRRKRVSARESKMVCVLGAGGKPLMPTNIKRARKLLGKGRAEIFGHDPFTIRLLDREDGKTQPVEYKCDTGYQHIGISICTEKQELFSQERTLLPDETEKHDACRKYRRDRRTRKRYRAPRFDNRKSMRGKDKKKKSKPRYIRKFIREKYNIAEKHVAKKGANRKQKQAKGKAGTPFAPGIRNRRDQHILLFQKFAELVPITDAVFEMGQFDTQVLQAMETGKPLPQGTRYQHGPRYGFDTLRAAVFARDGHTCQVCGKGIKEGAILRVHHLGFRTGDHTDRMSNLLTVCTKCHTPGNHNRGGRLWNLKPVLKPFKGATFMTTVRWDVLARLREIAPDVRFTVTYGTATKEARTALNISKSHVNDAYAMGKFHPKKRVRTTYWKKRRRNNRILEKFYDALYIDLRDGEKKPGASLSCGRTNRSQSRHGLANEREYRAMRAERKTKKGCVVSKGKRSIRTQRYGIQSGDMVMCMNMRAVAGGMHNKGAAVMMNGRSVTAGKVRLLWHANGWIQTN